uniref:5'-deoxynucleotidase n=1 Tax=uncultured marine thaumarchaeote KM3_64_C01 TaxID=1456221 RepID=A0A075HB93_9ARCH|nr:metal dependent phosphohydrolase [uncultured marine thaumarchaeote KM3_64_C01]
MIEDFFQKVLELKNVPRRGWKEKLGINNPESVADHSYSTTVMSMILSDMEGLNSEKIIRMALLHDLAESVIGDITPEHITKNEKNNKENLAMKQILKNLSNKIAKPYFEIWNEYQENSSREAILIHDIDKLEMAFQAKFYQDKGISKEKLQTFFNTAKKEIKNKNLCDILSNFIE